MVVTDYESECKKLLEWIIWARGEADFFDPLIGKNDIVLGKGSSIFDLIINE